MNGSTSLRQRLLGALLGAAALALAIALARPAAADMPPDTATTGVWQQHKLSFQFLGFTSTYSCDGLADKLRLLLLASGARADVKAQPGACASPYGRPDKFARADLTFYTLSPTGAGATAAAGSVSVAGLWKAVSLSQHSPQELGLGDCELVEQFRTQVLKLFATRALENHTTCIPYQESGSLIDLRFQVFTAARPPAPPAAAVNGAAPGQAATSAPTR